MALRLKAKRDAADLAEFFLYLFMRTKKEKMWNFSKVKKSNLYVKLVQALYTS